MSEDKYIDVDGPAANPDEAYEKRRRWARLFAIVCLVGAALWGASVFKRVYPHDVQIQYHYKDIARPGQLAKVHASLFVEKEQKPHAMVTYFHHGGVASPGRTKRRQRLRLPKGAYPLYVTLHYKGGKVRKLQSVLQIRDSGTYHVRLRQAR